MADVRAITIRIGDDGATQTFEGCAAWALANLVSAGATGCTPLDHPGPRWAHYVYLPRKAGIVVETLHEQHFGAYAGHHGRYVLRTALTVVRELR